MKTTGLKRSVLLTIVMILACDFMYVCWVLPEIAAGRSVDSSWFE